MHIMAMNPRMWARKMTTQALAASVSSSAAASLTTTAASGPSSSSRSSPLWPLGLAVAMAAMGALWPTAPVQSESALSRENKRDLAVVRHQKQRLHPHQRLQHRSVESRAKSAMELPMYKDVRQQYSLGTVIGQGGFGQVHMGLEHASQDAVAIKHVDKKTTSKAKFLQEVDILREMGGQNNVLRLREAFETLDAYVLVTELVDGDELFERLVQDGTFSEDEAKPLIAKLAETLAYLHAHRVVHGDIKPENILLSADDVSSMRLIDFGQSFRLHAKTLTARAVPHSNSVATMAYAPPEVLRGEVAETGSGVDMWALGIVLFILLCGHHPFDPTNDATDDEMCERILNGKIEYDTDLSADAQQLISKLLESDPTKRLSANQVLQHSWIQQQLSTAAVETNANI